MFKKPVYRTLLYYVVVIVVVGLFNVLPGFKSGPCTPNFDVLSVFLAFIGTVVLFVINGVRLMRCGKIYLSSVLIHAGIIAALVIGLAINS
jgi:hypothetical protein